MAVLRLFHGSDKVIERPEYGKGRPFNDYGLGFYCTEHRDLACEWACREEGVDGFANEYTLDAEGLQVLRLSSPEYSVLHWLTVLLAHRLFDVKTPVALAGKAYLEEHYSLPVDTYDLVIGHRADDSYFSFARAFLRNDISLEQLSRAMRLGDLGEQVVLKSPAAFDRLEFAGAAVASSAVYYPRRKARDGRAQALYREEALRQGIKGIYLRDILEGRVSGFEGLR